MNSNISTNLEEIADSLTVPELDRMGYMYIPVIRKGISDMSGGKIVAEALAESRPHAEEWHYTYALFFEGMRVGQFMLHPPGQAMVTAEDLRDGIRLALKAYPTNRCVHIDKGSFSHGPGDLSTVGPLEPTEYDHVFLGPALPKTLNIYYNF